MFLPDGGQLRLPLFLDEYCILRFLVVTSFGEFARRPDALHQNLLRHRPKGVECRLCGPWSDGLRPCLRQHVAPVAFRQGIAAKIGCEGTWSNPYLSILTRGG
jgi:hypothetical protein